MFICINQPIYSTEDHNINKIMDITSLQRDRIWYRRNIWFVYVNIFYNTSALREYKVVLEDEMRVDLFFKNIYGIESSVLHLYLHDDIILYINNIDNPLSIKEGMLLRYPLEI
jgi:hypothetical protein